MNLDEAAGAATQVKSSLDSGVEVVSNFQEILFTRYVKVILPLDGFVFWVKADLLSKTALLNAALLNASTIDQLPVAGVPAKSFKATGDLHYETTDSQDETTSFATNHVVFTSEVPINDLNNIGRAEMYIGEIDGVRFSFSKRGYFQQNAMMYHYVGDAVFADMETQIVDDARDLDTRSLVVSNSLPIWLAMSNYRKADWEDFGNGLTLYPSFLIPDNLRPPYGVVHVAPESTRGLAAAPLLSPNLTHTQLATDRVEITIYGQRNDDAQDFLDFVLQQSVNNADFGVMNIPILRDEKRTQVELSAIAMKKRVDFEINYYQTRVRDVARQLILDAVPTYYPQ